MTRTMIPPLGFLALAISPRAFASCPTPYFGDDCVVGGGAVVCDVDPLFGYACDLDVTGSGGVADLKGEIRGTILSVWGTDSSGTDEFCCQETITFPCTFYVFGGPNNDTIQLYASNQITCANHVLGGAGMDLIRGSSVTDILDGDSGNDTIHGNGGSDTIDGGLNNDLIFGGAGADSLFGLNGIDTIWGGDGDDFIDGGLDGDELHGEANADSVKGGPGVDLIYGEGGDDTLAVNSFPPAGVSSTEDGERISGGDGIDQISGANGADDLIGGIGNDTIYGYSDSDVICGEQNDDYLDGGPSDADEVYGGTDADTLSGGSGVDDYCEDDPEPSVASCEDTDVGETCPLAF
jgi:Ca2+-binding RTX toxin-like protein